MIFDKTTVINGVKLSLSATEKRDTEGINLALGLCLDDLSNKLQSDSLITSWETTASADDRTLDLSGNANDLRYLFAIKIGSGSSQKVLDYIDKEEFLRERDDPSLTAGTPSYYTILTATDGTPTAKFDVPFDASTTVIVYYWPELTPDNINQARSAAAIVAGTVAWFRGIGDAGATYYAQFEKLVGQMRASDNFLGEGQQTFRVNRFERNVNVIKQNLRDRRA